MKGLCKRHGRLYCEPCGQPMPGVKERKAEAVARVAEVKEEAPVTRNAADVTRKSEGVSRNKAGRPATSDGEKKRADAAARMRRLRERKAGG